MKSGAAKLTTNGIHLNSYGYWAASHFLSAAGIDEGGTARGQPGQIDKDGPAQGEP
jgi:hypothetical protein